jgi:N-acyl-D-aspartate/D-glutamate deacylase
VTGELLIRGGTVVDGTGAPARVADVRIRDGVVVELDAGLAPDGEPVVDASGTYVAPGFIDCHTHYDPSLWWDPLVDPMPQHGVTTVVTGNCSLSLTPVHAPDRVRASDVFGFIEDIPVDAFTAGIPWTWESYAEWRDALREHGTAVNVAALVGHSNLRVFVMGDDAWTRAATADERAQLATVLAESLAAGAVGMSTSFVDQDRHGKAVPSRAADHDELRALVEVLGAAPGHARVLEFLPWIKELDRQLVDIERVARWCGEAGVACTWNQLAENSRDPSRAERILEQAHALHADGCRVYGQVSPRPFDLHVSFDQTPAFVAIPAWGKFIALPTADEKRATLADPEWRAEARAHWDRVGDGFTIFPVSRLDRVRLTSVREGEEQFLDRSFADVVAARGGHPSDVLADWVLEHDLAPGMVAEALSNNNSEKVSALIADATTVVGASDAGAHLQMMCGAGDSTLLLTEHVRDRGDLTVEDGVHQMTGRIAEVFGIRDRGVLAPGRAGDVTVFALDELDYRPDRTVHDLPGDAPRLTRPPGGFRVTAVEGVVTQEGGVATGARPGGPLDGNR